MIYIPHIHDRVVHKCTLTLCRVTLVNIHARTVDLFTLRGVGELIKDVPYADVIRVVQGSPLEGGSVTGGEPVLDDTAGSGRAKLAIPSLGRSRSARRRILNGWAP